MAEPKVHINAPTYSAKEAMEITGLTWAQMSKVVDPRALSGDGELYWNEMAKLVVARKILMHLPIALLSPGNQARIMKMVMDGPTPRAGTVMLKPDGAVYYLSTGLTSNHQGIAVKWDGTLMT